MLGIYICILLLPPLSLSSSAEPFKFIYLCRVFFPPFAWNTNLRYILKMARSLVFSANSGSIRTRTVKKQKNTFRHFSLTWLIYVYISQQMFNVKHCKPLNESFCNNHAKNHFFQRLYFWPRQQNQEAKLLIQPVSLFINYSKPANNTRKKGDLKLFYCWLYQILRWLPHF